MYVDSPASIVSIDGSAASVIISLVVAVVAAILGAATTQVQRLIQNRRLRRKYPIGGRFVTEYQDVTDTGTITRNGEATLGWKRDHISGEDLNTEEGRAWKLEGTMDATGFLAGIYRADDPYDTGNGTFFLRIEGRDMYGLWAGYDSVNRQVVSGNYTFRQRPDGAVRRATPDEAGRVVALLGDALGESYVDLGTVEEAITGDGTATCLVEIDSSNRLLGAVTCYIVTPDSLDRFLPEDQGDLVNSLRVCKFNTLIGLLRSLAVAPNYRRRGVATDLTEACITWCAEHGASTMMTFAWLPHTDPQQAMPQLTGVLKHAGFTLVETIDNYWTQDSQSKRYQCPVCGPTCTCAAAVYARAILEPASAGSPILARVPPAAPTSTQTSAAPASTLTSAKGSTDSLAVATPAAPAAAPLKEANAKQVPPA
jgi:GNAT superfamily N-acetyltransferase